MKRKKEESLRDLLNQFLRDEGLETPLMEYRIMQEWPTVAGKVISRYTGELYIKNEVLHVQIKSPALRQNLSMMQTELTKKLNDSVGRNVITSIRFY